METVGLIGCGGVAEISYINILNSFFSNQQKLFYDIDGEAAASFAQKAKGISTSLENLISESDFIIITTPPESHYEILLKCIKPGKTVFCEKPFLLHAADALHIMELCESQKAKVFAGYVRRFYTAPKLARDYLKMGLIGDIEKIEVFEGGRFSWESRSGYHYKNKYGGVLPDTGSHSLDSLLFILGLDDKDIYFKLIASKRTPESEPSHVFKAKFTIETESIINASVSLSRRESLSNKINIYGRLGTIEIPLDLKNAVKVSTPTGSIILREKFPVSSVEQTFTLQFQHILHEDGALLKAGNFLNTVKLIEILLK